MTYSLKRVLLAAVFRIDPSGKATINETRQEIMVACVSSEKWSDAEWSNLEVGPTEFIDVLVLRGEDSRMTPSILI